MNKKLIALAVAGACVAPSAMAQTANPVTLYGLVFGTIESVEATGGTAPIKRRQRVEDQSSRFGIRGTEDLGGGLKAFFNLETGFRIDSNNTTFATRNSAVGLQGGWGSLMMGRWDSPYKVAAYPADPWNLLTLAGYWSSVQDSGNFGRRPTNVVQYWTPNWAGFNARLAMTANEGKTDTANPRDVSAMVGWARGPVVVNVAYEKHEDQVGSTVTAGRDERGVMVVAAFTFGSTKLAGIVEKIKKSGRTDRKNYYVSVVQRFGSHALVGTVGQTKGDAASGTAAQPKADAASLGYAYTFSKRTQGHLMYSRITNNAASTQNWPLLPVPGLTAGADPRGLSIGLLHTF